MAFDSNRLLIRTVDLESTDFPPEGEILEAGYVDSVLEREHEEAPWSVIVTVKNKHQKFFKPDKECTIDARATHHIHPSEYANAEHHSLMPAWVLEGAPNILCAHNAPFEQHFIQHEFWIDTYKVALRLYPDFPRHTNQYLRYALGLELGEEAMPPHRATPDAFTTAHILACMLQSEAKPTVKQMIAWTRDLPYLTRIGFGEHFGKKFEEVPRSYLTWVLGKDFDPEVHAACRRALGMAP